MKKRLLFFAAVLLCAPQAFAKNVMCLKTNTGQYIEMARVSMMVVPDGGSTFEIVVKDGEGATNVESISFEKHESVLGRIVGQRHPRHVETRIPAHQHG